MNRRIALLALVLIGLFAWPLRCPAPLVYRAGEGWTYESPGGAKWTRGRAKDQYDVAKQAYDDKRYRLASKAARRTVARWPLSDYAAQAQYLLGLCYEARKWDEKAFKEYQKAIEKYPKIQNFDQILERQFAIAKRFMGGQWFKLWGLIPFFPSMEKTAEMFTRVVRNGPFSPVGPQAQMSLGATREKQREYELAVKAYEKAADMYHDDPKVASDALYAAALAWQRQAKTAEYDQGAAVSAIATFTDFITLYPNDSRVAAAQRAIVEMRAEQARGAMRIAMFYEKRHQWDGARVYYNEVVSLSRDPDSEYAVQARKRLAALKNLGAGSTPKP
jgi:outer membrane protein assembly factor BamD (BamD/ComL family)